MPALFRTAAIIFAGLMATAAHADGIEAGLWNVITQTAGDVGPPHQSTKCLTSEQVQDLATTFSPVATTVNSECAPMERSLVGTRLTWHLVCKGQLDMELSGEFDFDTPHHYTGKVRTLATMTGMPPMDQQNTLEGQWVSACK
jgi:hypothetical protein